MSYFSEVPRVCRAASALGSANSKRLWRAPRNRRLQRRRTAALAWLCCLWPLAAARALAQSDGILVVSSAQVSEDLERSVKRRLRLVGEVLDAADYASAARAARLRPDSEAALSQLGPRAGAQVIVRLSSVASGQLMVQLRSGGTASVLWEQTFALRGERFKQPARALRALSSAVSAALAQAANAPAAARSGAEAAAAPERDEDTSAEQPAGQAQTPQATASPSASTAAAIQSPEPEDSGELSVEDPELSARLAAQSPAEDDTAPPQGLALRLVAGMGPGTHALRVPSPDAAGTYGELDTGLAPTLELSAAAQLGLGRWLLRAEAQYRTVFGVEPAPVPAPMSMAMAGDAMSGATMPSMQDNAVSSLTSHSLVIGISPGMRFGGRRSVALLVMLGWTYRSLQPAVVSLPGGNFTGLVARPSLEIPLGEGVFCLRLAPELILVRASKTNALGFMAARASGGWGMGAEVALDARLAKPLGVGLQYRRSRVSVQRVSGGPAIDDEWYVTIQAVLSL